MTSLHSDDWTERATLGLIAEDREGADSDMELIHKPWLPGFHSVMVSSWLTSPLWFHNAEYESWLIISFQISFYHFKKIDFPSITRVIFFFLISETLKILTGLTFVSKHAIHRNKNKENRNVCFCHCHTDGPTKDEHSALWTNVFRSQQWPSLMSCCYDRKLHPDSVLRASVFGKSGKHLSLTQFPHLKHKMEL